MNISSSLVKIGQTIGKHSPEILTAIGIVGLITAGVTAVKNTPKAMDILTKAKENEEVEVTKAEVMQLCWKQYVLPVTLAGVSVVCIIFARRIDAGRTAALVTACKVSEEAAERFETTTREVVGEKAMTKIEDKIAEKDISSKPVTESDVVNTGSGDSLYFEKYSSRYFRASREYIDNARNEFNARLLDYDSMSINDWLECLGLPYLDEETTGTTLGWCVDDVRKKCGGHMTDILYSYHQASNGEPCGHICMDVRPIVNYS